MLPVCQQRLRFLNRSEELEDYIDAGNANTSTHRCIETVLEVEHDEILELDRVPDVPVGGGQGRALALPRSNCTPSAQMRAGMRSSVGTTVLR